MQACPAVVPRQHQLADDHQPQRCSYCRAMRTGDHTSRPLPHRHLRLPARRGACAYCQRQSTEKAAPPRLAQGPAIRSLGATSPCILARYCTACAECI